MKLNCQADKMLAAADLSIISQAVFRYTDNTVDEQKQQTEHTLSWFIYVHFSCRQN